MPKDNDGEHLGCDCSQHLILQSSYQENKKKILNGLKRAEGQLRGIQRMVEEERYCVDVLYQVAAVRKALDRLALIVLKDHTAGCVKKSLQEEERSDEVIQELMEVLNKFM